MANKYTRHSSVVNRQSDGQYSEDHWLKEFEAKLQKGAVQPRGESIFDQISTIMNGKSKYPSVQAAVDDMMQRSGLTDYLANVKVSSVKEEIETPAAKTATAQESTKHDKKLPKIIQDKSSILRTLENIIKKSKGNLSVPTIISRLHELHGADVANASDWDDEDLVRYVSHCNLKAKMNNPTSYENFDNLGQGDYSTADSEIDPSNTDAFNALMPAKI